MESFRLGRMARLKREDTLVLGNRRRKISLTEEDVPFAKEKLFLGNPGRSVGEKRVDLRCRDCRSPLRIIRILQACESIGDKRAGRILPNDALIVHPGAVVR